MHYKIFTAFFSTQVTLKPKPWTSKWHLWDLKGIEDISHHLDKKTLKKFEIFKNTRNTEYDKYDLMKSYRYKVL